MKLYQYIKPFFTSYLLNYFISYIPFWGVRKFFYKIVGIHLDTRSILDMGCYFIAPHKLTIGKYTHINRKCMLDARGYIKIGNNVSISHQVTLCSASHDFQSPTFDYISAPIIIEDNVWIGLNATILQGVTIREGCIIAAGSIVTKETEPYGVYAGIPAKKISTRNKNIQYNCTKFAYYRNFRKPYFK
ncbi:acyltransferase [Phocaeicola plebeius]|jgi:acetyltransferase-like isoleucine patch superfamily enzyme|uniref:acyltransferase n=1 Tax=Phocaeicola plebeius TaxID=310297 RepID=UPI00241EE8EE|nr:acyltransferase [Phocaeicola plebeius]